MSKLMDEPIPADVRRERMRVLIHEREFVQVTDLSALFGISEVTVRSDLKALESHGRVRRVRGGALPSHQARVERPFEQTQVEFADEKAAIGAAAAALVSSQETVLLDVGTTTAVARALVQPHHQRQPHRPVDRQRRSRGGTARPALLPRRSRPALGVRPEVIEAADGQRCLYYGSYFGGLSVRELPDDGLSTDPDTQVEVAIANRYEGTQIIQRDGYYYLLASATDCCRGPLTGYSVFAGRSTSPTGPFMDREGVSLLAAGSAAPRCCR